MGKSISSLPRELRGALAESSSMSPATEGSSSSGRPSIQRPKPGGAISAASALTKPFLEKAADAESKQHYKIAATIYRQACLLEKCLATITSWRTFAACLQW